MKIKHHTLKTYILFLGLLFSFAAYADGYKNQITWQQMPPLPPSAGQKVQHGLAFPFAGVHNNCVIVAGGCNFSDIPAAEGGAKKYHGDIFVFENNHWAHVGELTHPVAYGASISLPEGVLCIGGNNSSERFKEVFLLSWDESKQKLTRTDYPSLPFSISQMGAAVIGHTVYVVGGQREGQTANNFLSLDLSKKGSKDFVWEVLPDFPGIGREQPVVVAQNAAEETCLYIFSGASFPLDTDRPIVNTDGLRYSPKSKTWEHIGEISVKGTSFPLYGGAGVPSGVHNIVCVGGVNATIFKDAIQRFKEASKLKADDVEGRSAFLQWKKQYLSQAIKDYQFNDKILVFNTITKQWTIADSSSYAAKVSTVLVPTAKGYLLINGEVKPGIRTPEVYQLNLSAEPTFGFLNWLMLIVYLLAMLYLGYYFMKKGRNAKEFFTGGGRIPWWAAGISIFATMLSAITFMAIPAKVYATNWKYFPLAITILVMAFPVVKYYLPFFRRLNVTTAYEYLEKRFNYSTRFLASFLFIAFMTARMALVMFLPSLALSTVTGIGIYTCILLMGAITVIYSTMGGVEAVVWGDVIQGIVLMGGAILAVVFLVFGTEGGWNTVMRISMEQEKFNMLDWSFDFSKATVWVVVLGGLANNLISYSSDQTVIQRYLTTKDEKSAGNSIVLNGFLSIIVSVVFYFIGTALYAYYTTKPGNMNFSMGNADAVFPHFIMTEMPMGLAGLLIAAIFAATMSTVSSNVNSIATAFTADFYKHFAKNISNQKELKIARWSGIIFGAMGIILALLMATWNIRSLFDYFNYILGLLASGLGGLFVMGIFFQRIGGKAALLGFISGIIALLWISSYTNISFLLFGFIGIIISVTVAWILSFLLPKEKRNLQGLTWKTLR